MRGKQLVLNKRIMAMLMAVLMVLSLVVSSYPASAKNISDDEKNKYIYFKVVDEDNNPIKKAKVTFSIALSPEDENSFLKINGEEIKDKVVESYDDGYVLLISKDKITEDCILNATIQKENYNEATIVNKTITSETAEIDTKTLGTPSISIDIVKAKENLVYDGNSKKLVDFDGNESNYNISYSVLDSNSNEVSTDGTATEAGTYTVVYSVSMKAGVQVPIYKPIENQSITVTISKASSGVSILNAYGQNISENETYPYQPEGIVPFTVEGLDDNVIDQTYTINGTEYKNVNNIPKLTNLGTYAVTVMVDKGDNFEDYNYAFTITVEEGVIADSEVTISEPEDLYYNGTSQFLIGENSVTAQENDTIYYSLTGEEDSYSTTRPKGTNAKEYTIYIKVSRPKYKDYFKSFKVSIKKRPQNIALLIKDENNNVLTPTEINGIPTISPSVKKFTEGESKKFSFEIQDMSNYIDRSDDEKKPTISITSSNPSGISSVSDVSTYKKNVLFTEGGDTSIKIIVPGDDNNEDFVIEQFDICVDVAETIYFEKTTVEYILKNKEEIAESQAVSYYNSGIKYGMVTYRLDDDSVGKGIECNNINGKLSINNYSTLAKNIQDSDGTLNLKVIATKAKSRRYKEEEINYTLSVKFAQTPENAYDLSSPTGENVKGTSKKWYTKDAVVSPGSDAENYTISKASSLDLNSFKTTEAFDKDGRYENDKALKIWMMSPDGEITDQIVLKDVYIDKTNPSDVKIDLSEPVKKINENGIEVPYYNSEKVILTFSGKDITSGIDNFEWEYELDKSSAKISEGNYPEKLSGIIEKEDIKEEEKDGKKTGNYTAEIVFPENSEEINGVITIWANDEAGNKSDEVKTARFIVDMSKPVLKADYRKDDKDNTKLELDPSYSNTSIIATYDITEENFFSEDVQIKVTKNGNVVATPEVKWTDDKEVKNKHTGVLILDANNPLYAEGDYIITVDYTDRSGNKMDTHTSYKLVIDTTKPVITFNYDSKPGNAVNQEATIVITEHNFSPEKIIILPKDNSVFAKNIKGEEIGTDGKPIAKESQSDIKKKLENYIREKDNWISKGDTNTIVLAAEDRTLVNAIYNIKIDYTDKAENVADTCIPDEFIVDYGDNNGNPIINEKIAVTSKKNFFNKKAKITLTAFDEISGISKFEWEYNRAKGVSESNKEKDSGVVNKKNIKQDKNDKSKFTTVIELPKGELNEKNQLRGTISFTVWDNYNNQKKYVSDGKKIFVVDSISPTVSVELSEPDNADGSTYYYKKDIEAAVTVKEINFNIKDPEIVVDVYKYDDGEYVYLDNSGPKKWEKSEKKGDKDTYIGKFVIPADENDEYGDGDYLIKVSYTDISGNYLKRVAEFLNSGNSEKNNSSDSKASTDDWILDTDSDVSHTYVSKKLVIDTTKPLIEVEYDNYSPVNTLTDKDNNSREYYGDTRTATITINEHNFDESTEIINNRDESSTKGKKNYIILDFNSTDVSGNPVDGHISYTKWENDGDEHTIYVTYSGDANYSFSADYTDLATNAADTYGTDYFTVDKTKPTISEPQYSTSIVDTVLQNISFKFYNAKATVTLAAQDATSPINTFKYSYVTADGVSGVNSGLNDQVITNKENTSGSLTTTFEIPQDMLGANNQFNGTVNYTATDRAGNESDSIHDVDRLVVDNISPTADVTYNPPVNTDGGKSYYDDSINATINITEANFYSEDVQVSVTKDGGSYPVAAAWSDGSTDSHTGTFTLTEDGVYQVNITYTDKSTNAMATYTSEVMIIDTDKNAKDPIIRINDKDNINGTAYKDACVPSVEFEDDNLDSYEITLLRTRLNEKDLNVNDLYIKNHVTMTETRGTGTFDEFKKIQDNDGIYTLKIKMKDKAGHERSAEASFTVNRFGSVYVYSDYLIDLISDGGKYVQAVDQDLVITEYNPDKLTEGSLNIEITADGKPVENRLEDTVSPAINDKVQTGKSGWYQYDYTIDKNNFSIDGVYKMIVSSKDNTGNTPENTNYEDKSILFRVDSTPPELNSVSGLENRIVNATNLNVSYVVYDTMGLKNVTVYRDGNEMDNITDFTSDLNNYTGSFTLNESGAAQKIRIVAEDLAGNIIDTDSKDFSSAYDFNKSVTVSTNFFVRLFANKALFFISVGGITVLIAAIFGFIAFARRRKEEE